VELGRHVVSCLGVGRGGRISNREYQTLFGVSRRTAGNDLSELTTHELLVMEGAGRATRYRLTDSDA